MELKLYKQYFNAMRFTAMFWLNAVGRAVVALEPGMDLRSRGVYDRIGDDWGVTVMIKGPGSRLLATLTIKLIDSEGPGGIYLRLEGFDAVSQEFLPQRISAIFERDDPSSVQMREEMEKSVNTFDHNDAVNRLLAIVRSSVPQRHAA